MLFWLPTDEALPAESERPRPGVEVRSRVLDVPQQRRSARSRSAGSLFGASRIDFMQKLQLSYVQPSCRRYRPMHVPASSGSALKSGIKFCALIASPVQSSFAGKTLPKRGGGGSEASDARWSVSYTHLTLPTSAIV